MESMASGMTMTSTTTTTTAPVVASELTSTTAPGKVFTSRAELAAHYKSDWHKYNLKRREAGLPVLLESDFQARLEAAKAMRQEKQAGTGHLKADKKNANTNNNNSSSTSNKQGKKKQQQRDDTTNTTSSQGVTIISPNKPLEEVKGEAAPAQEEVKPVAAGEPADIPAQPEEDVVSTPTATTTAAEGEEEAAAIEIEPRQCLFDPHTSVSVQANVERMQRKYGFFIPDVEYLTDMEGLVGYCHEKIKLGQTCLYCQRIFTSWQGCQKHMIAKNHTKIRYEAGIDMEDFAVFYDFSAADAEFLDSIGRHNKKSGNKSGSTNDDNQGDEKEEAVEEPIAEEGEGDAGEWEDVSEDEKDAKGDDDNEEEEDEENLYEGFEDQVARLGFDVTILGELVLPDGRIVGHRSLRRYYKQRAPRVNDNAAVLAARSAASERLYRGQVYSIGNGAGTSSALVAAQAGIHPALVAGRAGKGILVPSTGGFFSQLSIYRYRAAIRKQRAGDVQGQRLYNKTNQNMNRMDKKANRLMNGVSVAHAKR